MSLSTQEQVVNVIISIVIISGLLSASGAMLWLLYVNPFIWGALVLFLAFLAGLLKDG